MPHSFYLTQRQSELYEKATARNDAYRENIDDPIKALLRQNREEILRPISKSAHFIDLGPGWPSKSLELVDYLTDRGVAVSYYAVDISIFFLDRAVAAVSARHIPAHQILRRFEDLGPILDKELAPATPRVIFLGLTFSNFELADIIQILHNITRRDDICIVCVQMPSGLDSADLVRPYIGAHVEEFAVEPLIIAGFNKRDLLYSPKYSKSAVRIQFEVIRDTKINEVCIPKGTTITTGVSYRHDETRLIQELEKWFVVRGLYEHVGSRVAVISLGGK